MSSKKIQLGIFVPDRPVGQIGSGRPGEAVGCLRDPLLGEMLAHLRSAPDVELHEGLNFRQALIESGEVWVGDKCLNDLDAFFWYCEVDRQPGSFDLEVLKTLSAAIPVVRDPARFALALDKYKAHLTLKAAGVLVPEFVLFDARVPERMQAVLERWGAAVLKPRRGGWGKGVTLIDSPEALRDTVGYVQSLSGVSPDQGYFLERFYDNDLRKWTSITMVDGEIAYAYRKLETKLYDMGGGRRKVLDADEKGGGVGLAELTDAHREQAHRACEALGLGLIGFDMIWTENGPMVVDENTSPGNYYDLYLEAGKNPGKLLGDWVVNAARRACS